MNIKRQSFVVKIRRDSRASSLKHVRERNLTSLLNPELSSLLELLPKSLPQLHEYLTSEYTTNNLDYYMISKALPPLFRCPILDTPEGFKYLAGVLAKVFANCEEASESFMAQHFDTVVTKGLELKCMQDLFGLLNSLNFKATNARQMQLISGLVSEGLKAQDNDTFVYLIRLVASMDNKMVPTEVMLPLFHKVFKYENILSLLKIMFCRNRRNTSFMVLALFSNMTAIREEGLGRMYGEILIHEGILEKLQYFCSFGRFAEKKVSWMIIFNLFMEPDLKSQILKHRLLSIAGTSIQQKGQHRDVVDKQAEIYLHYITQIDTSEELEVFEREEGMEVVVNIINFYLLPPQKKHKESLLLLLSALRNLLNLGEREYTEKGSNPYVVSLRVNGVSKYLEDLALQQEEQQVVIMAEELSLRFQKSG